MTLASPKRYYNKVTGECSTTPPTRERDTIDGKNQKEDDREISERILHIVKHQYDTRKDETGTIAIEEILNQRLINAKGAILTEEEIVDAVKRQGQLKIVY